MPIRISGTTLQHTVLLTVVYHIATTVVKPLSQTILNLNTPIQVYHAVYLFLSSIFTMFTSIKLAVDFMLYSVYFLYHC